MDETVIRDAEAADLSALAELWHRGWHEAHDAIVPAALIAIRTKTHFGARLAAALDRLRVAGPVGAPLGFHLCHGDELDQFFVDRLARGTGLAAKLLRDAETCIAAGGATQGWLACAIGNDRAARFYSREGWVRTGRRPVGLAGEKPGERYELTVWIHEKSLI